MSSVHYYVDFRFPRGCTFRGIDASQPRLISPIVDFTMSSVVSKDSKTVFFPSSFTNSTASNLETFKPGAQLSFIGSLLLLQY